MKLFLCPEPQVQKNSQAVWVHHKDYEQDDDPYECPCSLYRVRLTFNDTDGGRLDHISKYANRMEQLKMRRI